MSDNKNEEKVELTADRMVEFAAVFRELMTEVATTRTYSLQDSLISGYDPSSFMTRKGFTTIDKMLMDEQVFSVLEMKKAFLLGTGYQFILPSEVDNISYNNILEFVKVNFTAMYSGSLNKDLYEILTAHDYGFSTSEMLFEMADFAAYKGMYWVTRLRTVPPHSIDFYTDELGKLDRIIQRHRPGGTRDLPLEKMLLYTKNQRFDNPYGKSECVRCYKPWYLKDLAMKFWGIYLQRFASPFPVAKVPKNYGTNKTAALLDILDSIQQANSAVIPDVTELDFMKGLGSGSEYEKAINMFNQQIARAVLLPDLVGFGGGTKGGSFSLGQKHFELFISILNQERLSLADLINDRVIKPLVKLNFGEQEVYPELQFLPYEDDTLVKMLETFISLVDKGMPITEEDYNYFRQIMGLAELPEKFENINPNNDAKKLAERALKGAIKLPEDEEKPEEKTDDDSEATEEEEEEAVEDLQDDKFAKKATASRAPNKYEARIDFKKEDNILRDIENVTIKDLARTFKKMKIKLQDTITRRKIIEDSKLLAVQSLNLKYLDEVKISLKTMMDDTYDFGHKTAKKEIKALKEEQGDAENFDSKVVATQITDKQALLAAEELINNKTFQSVGNIKDDLLPKAKSICIAGIERGKSNAEVMKELDALFSGYTVGAAEADLAFEPTVLENIVRTTNTTIYGTARRQTARTKGIGDFIEMMMFSAIIDARTTARCISLDGFKAPKDDPVWNSITPSNHYFCRSRLRYLTQVDVAVDQIKPDKTPSLTKLREMPGGRGFI